ncbi:MAG: hypothetical protein EON55_15245 [Alphaproteobacteria bacterium]|nr:MAG: hypothetical protein EON55_15245 [Alphaproteobacteria bacterium]
MKAYALYFAPYDGEIERLVRRLKRLQSRPGYSWTRIHDTRLREFAFHGSGGGRNPEARCRQELCESLIGQKDALYVHLLVDREFRLVHDRATPGIGRHRGV